LDEDEGASHRSVSTVLFEIRAKKLTGASYAVPRCPNSAQHGPHRRMEWCWYYPYKEDTSNGLETFLVDFREISTGEQERLGALRTIWTNHLVVTREEMSRQTWEMLSSCETPWVTKVTALSGENGTSQAGRLFLLGEAYWQILPYLGGSCDVIATEVHALVELLGSTTMEAKDWEKWVGAVASEKARASHRAGELGSMKTDQNSAGEHGNT
jgi:hypothetical protein